MMLNNYNSNNKGWGKRDNLVKSILGVEKIGESTVDKAWITCGEMIAFHTQCGGIKKNGGKLLFFHKEIHKNPIDIKKEIHIFSTVYPQVMEAYEV